MMTFAGVGVITLRSPTLGDTQSVDARVNFQQSMNSTRYTYVKSNTDRKYNYTFEVDIQKLFQLQQFVRDNVGSKFSLTDFNGSTREVYFSSTPLDFSEDRFAAIGKSSRNERGAVTVEVIGA